MGSDFPVPRAQLPRVEVTPHERETRKLQMEQMLLNAIDQYDHFRQVDQGRPDPKTWKLIDSRESLRLFREREGGTGGYTSSSIANTSISVSEDDSANEYWEDIPAEAAHAAALSRGKLKSLLLVGELRGRVENAVYAVATKTNSELALVETFLQDDVADCAILNMMEGPTPENPLQFLGYKWLVKKAPGGGRIVRHREVLYLEYCGITTTRSGEQIGYLLIESVDLPGFPEMTSRNCVRAVQSVSILLRQKSDTVVDVFMTGVVEPSGHIARPLTSLLTAKTMFMIVKTMDLAECKRLTKMLVSMRETRERALFNMKRKPTSCGLCHQKRKFYNGVSLVDCSICGEVICSRCQTYKRVYVADGILGRYHRVGCCKTCVLAADPARPAPDRIPAKASISAQIQRQNSIREASTLSSKSSKSGSSRMRSSSESSVEDLNEIASNLSLQPVIQEDVPVPTDSRARRGSVEGPAGRTQGTGITLLPTNSLVPGRSATRTHSTTSRIALTSDSNALVPSTQAGYQLQRNRSGSSGSRAQGRHLLLESAEPIRPSPASPTFTSSAPAGTYDLRGQRNLVAAMPTPAARPAASSQQDLFARMMELRRVAESTYQTTQQNEFIMQQQSAVQRTPSHTSSRRGF